MSEDKGTRQQVEEDAVEVDGQEDLELKDEEAEKVGGGNGPIEIKDWGF